MEPIRFEPYIGKDYETQDFKILVLGESHYLLDGGDGSGREGLTVWVVNEFIKYCKGEVGFIRWMNTFTKFTNVIHGEQLDKSKIIDFWDKCCFYNYLQFPTKAPREKPGEWMFEESKHAFELVIKQTRPSMVFFWGKRLWDNFPKENYERIQFEGGEIDILKLDYDLPIIHHNHPSFGFGFDCSEEIIRNIELIKKYLST